MGENNVMYTYSKNKSGKIGLVIQMRYVIIYKSG